MTMDILVLLLRAIIIGVLLVSGIAKLFDREGTREAMIGFGVPVRLLPIATLVLPIFEIALAVGLVFAATAIPAAILTTALFVMFTVLVGRVVLAGENLECHCFGQLSSGPISWLTLVRNIALTLAAGIVWWAHSRHRAPTWTDANGSDVGITLLALGFLGLAGAGFRLWRNQLDLFDRIDELQAMIPAGRAAKPPVESSFARITEGLMLVDSAGQSVPVPSLKAPKSPAMLLFISSGCRACNALMPDVAAWQGEFDGLMPIAVIGAGDREDIAAKAEAAGVGHMYFRDDDDLTARLKVNGNPTAVLVDHDGFIRAKPMLGGVAIRRAIEELRRQASLS
jgi:thiol-disulfide isomerase/thioredoxin